MGLNTTDMAGIIAMGCTLDREDMALRGLTVEAIRGPFSRDREDVATYGSAENWLASNPASYIGKHVPPTLVILCRAERFLPPILEQGARFIRRLLEQGVPGDVIILPGRHMSSIAAIGQPGDPTFDAIHSFIEKA